MKTLNMLIIVCLSATACAAGDMDTDDSTPVELVAASETHAAITGPLTAAVNVKLKCGETLLQKYKPRIASAAKGATSIDAKKQCKAQIETHLESTISCDTSCCIKPATCEPEAKAGHISYKCKKIRRADGKTAYSCRCSVATAKLRCTECDLPELDFQPMPNPEPEILPVPHAKPKPDTKPVLELEAKPAPKPLDGPDKDEMDTEQSEKESSDFDKRAEDKQVKDGSLDDAAEDSDEDSDEDYDFDAKDGYVL